MDVQTSSKWGGSEVFPGGMSGSGWGGRHPWGRYLGPNHFLSQAPAHRWTLAHSQAPAHSQALAQGPWLQSLFSKKDEVVLWEAMGVIYRGHRKSLKSQWLDQSGGWVCQLLPDCYSIPAWTPGKSPAWGNQSYGVRTAKREGWVWETPPGIARATPGHQEGCLEEESLGPSLGRRIFQARERHPSLGAQHKLSQ